MLAAAQYNGLPPRILPSIHAVEGGFPGAIHPNRDGTDDLGVMQINTRWVGPLTGYVNTRFGAGMSQEAMHDRLVTDPCYNINAAAVIIHYEWTGAGGDWLRAVGNYHSHTPALHEAYLARVTAAARTLFGP